MSIKHVICPQRLRVVPAQFSWVDHRLVRDRHIERCDAHAAALYLFLVTVADAQGLSYYAETSLARALSMPLERLREARTDLIGAGLIAWAAPLYQVLALPALVPGEAFSPPGEAPALPRDEQRARLAQLRQTLGRRP